VDASAPSGRLSPIECDALRGYNRVLAYGPFGAQVLSNSIGQAVDWIPHGISLDKFQSRDRLAARIALQFDERDKVVGVVMTNQARKDWGVAIKALSLMPDYKMWCHIDVLERHWNLPALIEEYGVEDRIKVTMTGDMSDAELSYAFSACDVTMLPSSEGFGYPIAESLACGVPVVHSSYAGGNWGLDTVRYVQPNAFRVEGPFNQMRPVFDPEAFATAAMGFRPSAEECRASVIHLGWKALWDGCWKKWFLKGIANG
jgi:glycosyltransferase involved in cell wall biosynthesis